jgi:hypothetical protein
MGGLFFYGFQIFTEIFIRKFFFVIFSFRQVQTEHGGVLHEFSLDGINKQYDTIMKNKKKYVGEIVFKV